MTPKRDRRKHQRVALNILIQYRFESFEAFLSEYANDISEGGMFIRTQEAYEEGSMIYIQFSLTDGTKLIEGLGRVVRVNPDDAEIPGMGIEFVNFDEDSRAMIDAIVRERSAPTEDLDKLELD